jgi:hypothetical protein
VHVNSARSFVARVDDDTRATMTPIQRDRVARVQAFMHDEYVYLAIQSTRPGLVGVALTD